MLPTIMMRKPLLEWNRRLLQKQVTIGFLGGSITDARPRHNWPRYVAEWLSSSYPEVRFCIENAAIGATGSDSAALRVKRDIIERNCHVVFIEYAVNDEDISSARRQRTREGLIRQLLQAGISDIIFVYTYSAAMKDDMEKGQYPATIAELEKLAQHYNIPSIWVGKHGLEQVAAGRLTMEQWLPDGLHPHERGSQIYAESIIAYLQQQLLAPDKVVAARADGFKASLSAQIAQKASMVSSRNGCHNQTIEIPPALDQLCWEHVCELPLQELATCGSWLQQRWHSYEWIEHMLETCQTGASLSFTFAGRGLMLLFDYGSGSAEFQYRIDEGEWQFSDRDLPDWVGEDGWLRLFDCGDELGFGEHTFQLIVVQPQRERLNNKPFFMRLGKVGIIR